MPKRKKMDDEAAQAALAEVAERAEEEGISMELAAKRMGEEQRALDEAAEAFDRADKAGKIAPGSDDMPFEDDMVTEKETQAEKDARLVRELTAVLKVPKTKDSIMTFSMYTTGAMHRRYFLLDVDGAAYRKGWTIYKEAKGDDPVGYVDMVLHIMDHEIPRLHRAVDWAPLN